MDNFKAFLHKLNHNQQLPYASIRVFLGLALFIRGIMLIMNPDAIIQLVAEDNLFIWYVYIAMAHIIGGALITIGFFTRIGALIQIPVLLSAVFMVHSKEGLMMGGQSLELAVLVLFLLLVFFIFGPGKWSISSYFSKDF